MGELLGRAEGGLLGKGKAADPGNPCRRADVDIDGRRPLPY